MKSDDPRVITLATAIVAFIDGLAADAGKKETDELIPVTVEALAEHGFEHRAVLRFAETGKLRTVRIGRRRYTRMSWLAELAERLPAIKPPPPSPPSDPVLSDREKLLEELRGSRKRHFRSGS